MPVVKRDITEFARGDDSRRVVVRLIDGSAFVSVSLELAGRSRVLNRYKNEPLAQTLKRVQLAHVATMMVSKAKSQSASSERGTSKGQSAAKPPAVSLLGKNGKELSGELNNEKAWTEAMALVIGDRHYTVVQNPPSIVSLSLPELVMVGITVTPSLHLEFCEPHMCDFRWFLNNPDAPAGSEPDMVSTDPTFTPCEEHKGRLLAVEVIPKRDGVAGVPLRIAPLTEVSGAPTKLLFKQRVAHTPTPHKIGSKDMRVCTYNVLADQYLKMGDMHFYCPQHARDFSYRSQLLLAEMLGYNVDIFCLQEVDKGHFARFFEPQLKSRGFSGLLTLKMKVNEGCAIFWRDDRLKLVKQHDYLLRDEIVKMKLWDKLCNLPEFESAMRTRTTIMQALEMEFEGRPLLVANTHLYYHAEARHIRLLQSTTITHVLEELQAECSQRAGQTVPVLFCGDLNSHTTTGVFDYFRTGELSAEHPDWVRNASGAVRLDMKHNLHFDSINPDPAVHCSNFVGDFEGVLDHIFYDQRKLEKKMVVPVPSREDLEANTALPSALYPSDHLAVVADLAWKD